MIENSALMILGMRSNGFPNVIMLDYVGVQTGISTSWDELAPDIRVLCMGLNYYLVSENCAINKLRHPFNRKKTAAGLTGPSPSWNGVKFANGTVLDERPADFDPWKEDVLPAGTKFANGTVLTADIPYPW